MGRLVFGDESGTTRAQQCYSIGALVIPDFDYNEFVELALEKKRQHGVVGEVKWQKVSTSHGLINFGIDMFKEILSGSCFLEVIVVNKALYRNWHRQDRETAFYKTYTYLLKDVAERMKDSVEVKIDKRSNSYKKQHEVVNIIANHMLNRITTLGKLENVKPADSKKEIALQVVDFFTGAINTAHDRFLNPQTQMHYGKSVCIQKLSDMLGWDDLCYDTYPNNYFNIWQFPEEFRDTPKSLKVDINLNIPFISPQEISNVVEAI